MQGYRAIISLGCHNPVGLNVIELAREVSLELVEILLVGDGGAEAVEDGVVGFVVAMSNRAAWCHPGSGAKVILIL